MVLAVNGRVESSPRLHTWSPRVLPSSVNMFESCLLAGGRYLRHRYQNCTACVLVRGIAEARNAHDEQAHEQPSHGGGATSDPNYS